MAGGVAAFALWGVVATFLLLSGPRGESSTAGAGPDRPVIAVLPFTSGGSEEDSKTLSLGLHDDLLTRLSKIKALRVISRTSMMQYQETTKDIRAIGRELGAAAILEGSVLAVGDQVRVNAQLIDASTDEHLWADNYQMAYTQRNTYRRAKTLELAGRLDEARVAWDSMAINTAPWVEENPDVRGARITLARAYAALGRGEEAVQHATIVMEDMPFTRDAVAAVGYHYQAAEIFALVGEPTRAVQLLELLLDRNSGVTAAELAADPELGSLRDRPDFRALIER